MKIHWKSTFLGGAIASSLFVGTVAALLFMGVDDRMVFHEQALPSGKTIKIVSFNLVWGIDHRERTASDDNLQLEFVLSKPDLDGQAMDLEVQEAFWLIRPVSEQWGFSGASVIAYPTARRKGAYHVYAFTRRAGGEWTFEKRAAKVHIND